MITMMGQYHIPGRYQYTYQVQRKAIMIITGSNIILGAGQGLMCGATIIMLRVWLTATHLYGAGTSTR
jgi:hypothetical protein